MRKQLSMIVDVENHDEFLRLKRIISKSLSDENVTAQPIFSWYGPSDLSKLGPKRNRHKVEVVIDDQLRRLLVTYEVVGTRRSFVGSDSKWVPILTDVVDTPPFILVRLGCGKHFWLYSNKKLTQKAVAEMHAVVAEIEMSLRTALGDNDLTIVCSGLLLSNGIMTKHPGTIDGPTTPSQYSQMTEVTFTVNSWGGDNIAYTAENVMNFIETRS